jgi:hypothetical protein
LINDFYIFTAERLSGEKGFDIVSQGAVKKCSSTSSLPRAKSRGWGVKFYALAISVFIHVVGLSIFAGIKLSKSPPVQLQTTAVVSISQAQTLAERASVAPKPRVSPATQDRPIDAAQDRRIARTNEFALRAGVYQIFDIPKQNSQQQVELPKQPSQPEASERTVAETLPQRAEFFGSPAQGRRICYVVDCSGSMQGLWQGVKKELVESIGQLQPDQYFTVIIFGSGSILESGGGRLVRATERAKKDASVFIDSLRPMGATNALAAMQRGITIKDNMGTGPALIYFLTDGFELNEQDSSRFAHQVSTMLRSFSPNTKINTIGFWAEKQDRRMLETIAKDSGGEFVPVGDENSSAATTGLAK